MTKAGRQQLIETWGVLGELVEHMGRKLSEGFSPEENRGLLDSLAEYQSAVVAVGEIVDRTGDGEEQKKLIGLLEEHCEEAYCLYMAIAQGEGDGRECCQALCNSYDLIAEMLRVYPVELEVLFLPYKFSMWDSLESIYLAARADTRCKAVVMPIPYLEKNAPEREQTEAAEEEWRYEGAAYEGIPIVDYHTYDLGEHRPDIIYFHNPYDQYNLVTAVAPAYYSAELKKYCRKLVYVPYFYVGVKMPESHLRLPAYEAADVLVLPSREAVEQMRRFIPAKKLLPLGSPKLDRMIAWKHRKEMPKDWSKMIGNRRTVLYNVSIGSLLKNGIYTLRKMRYVFEYFQGQEKLVLWWRPHPLLKSTLKSMRPELLESYEELEREYLQKHIGIYDTTPDSNKAVAATDAFLGDHSSLANLYGITGKPVFYLDDFSVQEASEEDRRTILLEWFLREKDGSILFCSSSYQTFVRLNVETGAAELLGQSEGKQHFQAEYVLGQADEDTIVLSPFCANRIGIYRRSTGKIRWLSLQEPAGLYKYGLPVIFGKEIFFCPVMRNNICCYHRSRNATTYYGGYEELLGKYREHPTERLFSGTPCQVGERLYFVSYRVNAVLEFNMATKVMRIQGIGKEGCRFSEMEYDGTCFWLTAWDGSCLVRWNPKTGDTKKFTEFPAGYHPAAGGCVNPDVAVWSRILELDGMLYVFPLSANMLLKIDPKTEKIEEWRLPLFYREGQRKSSLYADTSNYRVVLRYDETHIIAQTAYDRSLLFIDVTTDEVRRIPCRFSKEDFAKLDRSPERYNIQWNESDPYQYTENGCFFTLKDMMDYFASGADMQEAQQIQACTEGVLNVDGTCGEKIHHTIMDKIGHESI